MRTIAVPVAALLTVTVSACASLEPLPPDAVAANLPLVTIETRGGLCPEGECRGTTVIEADGDVILVGDDGRIAEDLMTPLRTAIAATDFVALRAVPFDGTCPTAWDGVETVYTFRTPHGDEQVASCEVAIDPDQLLFRVLEAAIGSLTVSEPAG